MEESTPPKTSLLSQKLPGGQALVNNIQQKVRNAISIKELIIAMESNVIAGVISMANLVACMEEQHVFLEKRECDLLERRFTNSTGDLEYFRLIKTLDIGTPSDHMDPMHFEDILPQPYRMISKILELEILDVAWLEILRKHPEVAEDIPGSEGYNAARRNKNLDRDCHPSAQIDKIKKVVAMGGGHGEFAFSINMEGSFQIMHASSGKIMRTLQLFPMEEEEEGGEETTHRNKKDGSLIQRVDISNASVAEYPTYISRVAVLRIQENIPKPVEEDTGKKGKKVDKKAVPEENIEVSPFKCQVTIVETSGKSSSTFDVRVLNNFECYLAESHIHAELSSDGRALTICHGLNIDFFKLVPMAEIIDPFNVKSTVNKTLMVTPDEDDESVAGDNLPQQLEVVPPPLQHWNIQHEITTQTMKLYSESRFMCEKQRHTRLFSTLDSSRVWKSFLFPFQTSLEWSDATDMSKKIDNNVTKDDQAQNFLSQLPPTSLVFGQQQSLTRNFQNGLVVFLENVKAFFVFGLRGMTADERKSYDDDYKLAMDAAVLAAGGTLDDGKEIVPVGLADYNAKGVASNEKKNPLLSDNPPFLELISFWHLSDVVSAVDVDSYKSVLVIGQADGVISIWDTYSMQIVDVPARHQSLVTALSLTSGSKAYALVSGDVQGNLCFFNVTAPSGGGDKTLEQAIDKGGSSFLPKNNDEQCVKAELIDFRSDFSSEQIASMWSIPQTAIVIVQLLSMKLVAYDAETAELYGRISLTSGVPGQRIKFSLLQTLDGVLYYIKPPLTEEEEEQRLLEEAEEESKSKGKKGKASKEQAVSQEELDSLPPPEPSKYMVRKDNGGMASSCAGGFCGYFLVDDEKRVISTFSTERIITFFCVGVSSVLKNLAMSSGSSFDHSPPSALEVYLALTKDERNNENLKPSHVAALQDICGVVDASTSSQKSSRSSLKKSNMGNSSLLTEAKLKALQKSYSPFENIRPLPPISTCIKRKVIIPKSLFEKNTKTSQLERNKRKKALLSRMEALSGMC